MVGEIPLPIAHRSPLQPMGLDVGRLMPTTVDVILDVNVGRAVDAGWNLRSGIGYGAV